MPKRATPQRRKTDALGDSEQRFTRFMAHLPGLAWIKDRAGRYVYANDAAEKALGLPRAGFYGKPDDDIFPPETASRFKANDRRALETGTSVQSTETLRQPDGLHHSLVTQFVIPGPDGVPALIGGIAIDITELKRAEEALQQAARRKDEFLATLAHELRNPLAPIRNAVQLLQLQGLDAPDAQWALDVIDRQSRQMARLMDDLLDVARITRNRLEMRMQRVELADVVRTAVETSRPLIEELRHRLTVNVPPGEIFLDADLTRLAQALSNLLNNAAKYTHPGGHIELSVERQDGAVLLKVRDSGIGIPAATLSGIFELFAQADHSLERSPGGLGIGLSLARRLIALHGGTLTAHSDGPGKGSEFTVRLPVAAGAAAQPAAPRPPPAKPAPRRILLVDDNRLAAMSLSMLLRSGQHEVRLAHDGEEAVRAAAEFRPEIVVLDIGLPKLNGYDAARKIRQEPWGRKMVLIALTGWGQDEDKRRAREAGFDHHLVKPVDAGTLTQLLASLEQTRTAAV